MGSHTNLNGIDTFSLDTPTKPQLGSGPLIQGPVQKYGCVHQPNIRQDDRGNPRCTAQSCSWPHTHNTKGPTLPLQAWRRGNTINAMCTLQAQHRASTRAASTPYKFSSASTIVLPWNKPVLLAPAAYHVAPAAYHMATGCVGQCSKRTSPTPLPATQTSYLPRTVQNFRTVAAEHI